MTTHISLYVTGATEITVSGVYPGPAGGQVAVRIDTATSLVASDPAALDRLGALCIAGATALRDAAWKAEIPGSAWAAPVAAAIADLGFGGAT